ncbi:DUF1178 family protein [Roseibium algae]|uniref:DUF1178 family protein n=1 Tax=Roseibium algae TaxID=3123038 RepID=A0ABU8TNJ9_9HYPH
MIRFTLACEASHRFEGWFRNSEDFDRQIAAGLVTCPACGSVNVQKGLMAPAISTSRSKENRPVPEGGAGSNAIETPTAEPGAAATATAIAPSAVERGAAEPVAAERSALVPMDSKHKEILEALKGLRKKITETSDYVGKDFAEEARKIHYGETKERNIYGETTKDDAKSLIEEGISVLPLPVLPEEKN